MTTLLSWVSFSDTGESPDKPRAVYLASDSRITWGSAEPKWDSGRKTFAPTTAPYLFGFSGDVVLPGLILGQVTAAIDAGVLVDPASEPEAQHDAVLRAVERAVSTAVETPSLDFTIHHLMRSRDWPDTEFRGWAIHFDARTKACTSKSLAVPATTGVVGSFGTGDGAAREHRVRWLLSDVGGRSRSILSSFLEAIASGDDPLSGGAPQLSALYTEGPPVQIGLIIGGRRYLNGLEVDASPLLHAVEWRDALGQTVGPDTGSNMPGARRFARPRGT